MTVNSLKLYCVSQMTFAIFSQIFYQIRPKVIEPVHGTFQTEHKYRSPNINEEINTKIQNTIKEVSKWECIIMGYFNHGHIQ